MRKCAYNLSHYLSSEIGSTGGGCKEVYFQAAVQVPGMPVSHSMVFQKIPSLTHGHKRAASMEVLSQPKSFADIANQSLLLFILLSLPLALQFFST